MSLEETNKRWMGFIEKIEARFHEVLPKMKELMPRVFESRDFDPNPFLNAWQGVSNQTQELIGKITETWEDKVNALYLDLGYDYDSPELISARSEGFQRQFNLEMELKKYEVQILAEASRKLLTKVRSVLESGFHCSQCQAQLPVRKNFFRSHYVTCYYCQTVNTFEPGIKARNIEHFALDALGEADALDHFINYESAKFENYLTDKDIHSQDQLEQLYKKYIESFLKKRVEIIPEYQDRYEKDLESKIKLLSL